MAEISFGYDFQPDKANKIFCGQCGCGLTVTPRQCEVCQGFRFHCLRCGAPFNSAGKPCTGCGTAENEVLAAERQRLERLLKVPAFEKMRDPRDTAAKIEANLHNWGIIDLTFSVGGWLRVCRMPHAVQDISKISLRLRTLYRHLYGRLPRKANGHIVYSGDEWANVLAIGLAKGDDCVAPFAEWALLRSQN